MEITIRPTSGVYATYRRLSYKPWFAVAEFVDNSTQSYFDNRDALRTAYLGEGRLPQVRVEITYDSLSNCLKVTDSAFGMEAGDFSRALVLDSPPKNQSGRSEFGMGLKTAACWFGSHWTIESTQLGSNRILRASIDVNTLAQIHPETIDVSEISTSHDTHFTCLTIQHLYHPLRERTIGRMKDQLASMYRADIRSGEVAIFWNGVPLAFEEQPILVTITDNIQKEWKKEIAFSVPWEDQGVELPVKGWIGIRAVGKQRDAGLVLLRRNRVIVGGPGEGYRPPEVFGAPNMFRSQRLMGELHLDDWPVTQAKDQFDWAGGLEEAFIDKLVDECRAYGEFADSYRTPPESRKVTGSEMEAAAKPTQEIVARPEFGEKITVLKEEYVGPKETYLAGCQVDDTQLSQLTSARPTQEVKEASDSDSLRQISSGPITYEVPVDGRCWTIRLHWQSYLADTHWMHVDYPTIDDIDVFLNVGHPFFAPYLDQRGMLELLHKFVVSLALAEKLAQMISPDAKIPPSSFRTLMNKILKIIGDVEVQTYGARTGGC